MKNLPFLLLVFFAFDAYSQNTFTLQDTLRGSITEERAWWDLAYYHLDVTLNPDSKSLEGSVDVYYQVLDHNFRLQIDLQEPLKIRSVVDELGQELKVESVGAAHFITLKEKQNPGDVNYVTINYGGIPHEAIRPPWQGGMTWEKDTKGFDVIHTNCQGIGASIWWPNKDHLYDEPDSMLISVTIPEELMDISNGKLRSVEDNKDGTKTWNWFVSNPISNYVINLNIARYEHFSEVYKGEKGNLDMDYYVFEGNLEKAKKQFKDAVRTMQAFEYWFGPYPFYEDGYKLVEVTSTGMEHQSSVTYGNGYKNGYRGRDGSGTGHGFKFDFIIIHESGHEWFANNITYKDIADMWIHESFTNYSESLFLEYHYSKEIGQEYVRGTRKGIQNDEPIIGTYGVNQRGSGDMYVKGGNLLNTLRTVVNNDDTWRSILRGLNEEFYHQTVTTDQIESYIEDKVGLDLNPFFDQYLRDVRIPTLEYYKSEGKLFYRWGNCIDSFDMPVDLVQGSKKTRIKPVRGRWNSIQWSGDVNLDPNFYVSTTKAF